MTASALPNRDEIYRFLTEKVKLPDWPATDMEQLAGALEADARFVPAQGYVFDTSHQADDAYFVYSGQVRQSAFNADNVEWWRRVLGPGDLFTQQALFRGASYASTAQAEQDSVLLRISAALLSDLLVKHPDLWSIFFKNTAKRLQAIPLLRALDDDQIERLSTTADELVREAGEPICRADQEDAGIYVINRGQVRITHQVQTELSGGGRLIAVPPTAEVREEQGFADLPHILTAGNYFMGGLARIPHQLSVSAEAVTRVTLIHIAAIYIEQLEEGVGDVRHMLRHRPKIATRLHEALHKEELFADLEEEHWAALATVTGWEHVPSNLDVTRQGQIGSKLYVLSAGEALVRATDDSGFERPRHYSRVGIKDFYGINALLRSDRHGATVRSMVGEGPDGAPLDGTDWLTLQHDDVLYLIQSDPDLWRNTRLWVEMREKPKEAKRYGWQEDDEEIKVFKRQHVLWLILRLAGVFLAAYLALALMMALDSVTQWSLLNPATYALLSLVLLGLPTAWFVIDYLNDYYIITTKRVLTHGRVLLIYENQQTAPLERIQDVTSRASILGKLFNYADLDITTAGLGVLSFKTVPDPDVVEAAIRALQSTAKAGASAEQRENLRNTILANLKMRLIPTIPPRVLPDGMEVTEPLSGWQRFWHSLTSPWRRLWRWLSSLPERAYLGLLRLFPARTRAKILQEREMKRRKKPQPMEDDIVYRKHPWFLLKAAIIPLTVIVFTIALYVFTDVWLVGLLRELSDIFAASYAVFLVICAFWLWFRVENWRNDTYILSKTHISYVYKIPLGLYERRRQAEWEKVQNANYVVPGLWANIINFGTVVVETASVEGKFEFLNIGNPRKVQKEIMMRIGLTRAAQAQRDRDRQQAALSETLEIYNELIQEWTIRNQRVGAPPPPGVQVPSNGQPQA